MLTTLLNVLYVPVCIFLILVVLLQTGKRADLAGAFGGGGSQTAFGARGAATLLTKLTTAAAVLFMLCALSLSILTSKTGPGGGSVLDQVETETPAETPAPDTALPGADAATGDTLDPTGSEGEQPAAPDGSDSDLPPVEPAPDDAQP